MADNGHPASHPSAADFHHSRRSHRRPSSPQPTPSSTSSSIPHLTTTLDRSTSFWDDVLLHDPGLDFIQQYLDDHDLAPRTHTDHDPSHGSSGHSAAPASTSAHEATAHTPRHVGPAGWEVRRSSATHLPFSYLVSFDDGSAADSSSATMTPPASSSHPGAQNSHDSQPRPKRARRPPDDPPSSAQPSASSPPATKRARRDGHDPGEDGPSTRANGTQPRAPSVTEVDEGSALEDALRRQRAEQVAAQQPAAAGQAADKPLTLASLTCVICLDTPTDLTATSCGHLFCHACLTQSLISHERRALAGEAKRSQCPVCRKAISRTKANDVIPLLLKKGPAQPRRPASATIAQGRA